MKLNQILLNAALVNSPVGYPSACERICQVAASMSLELTPKQAEEIWERWSARTDASWLGVLDDDEVVNAIRSFVEDRLGISSID